MKKKRICATVNKETDVAVRKIAKKELRSFSQMVNVLLQEALKAKGL